MKEVTVTLMGHVPGTVDKTLFCHLEHSAAPVYLHVRALFEVNTAFFFLINFYSNINYNWNSLHKKDYGIINKYRGKKN